MFQWRFPSRLLAPVSQAAVNFSLVCKQPLVLISPALDVACFIQVLVYIFMKKPANLFPFPEELEEARLAIEAEFPLTFVGVPCELGIAE